MSNKLLMGLSSLLLPLGLYGVPAQSSTSYQRSYLSASINSSPDLSATNMAATHIVRAAVRVTADELDIVSTSPVKELVIIDAAVPDKAVFYRAVKPGVDIVEIDSSQPGLAQLKTILKNYQGLKGLHIVSHAEEGVMLLGNSRVDSAALTNEKDTFASLNAALIHGADLVLYGCDLASGYNGGELLDIIRSNTHVDVAASNNKTGNSELDGDWDLEIQRGNIETELAFSEKALRDFTAILAPVIFQMSTWDVVDPGFNNKRFTPNGSNNADSVNIDAQVSFGGKTLTVDGEYNSISVSPGYGIGFGFSEKSITLSFTDGSEFKPSSIEIYSTAGDSATITTNNGGSMNVTINDKYATNYTNQMIDLSSLPAGATSITITNNSWAPFVVNTNSGFMGAIRKITFDSIGSTNQAPTINNLNSDSLAWPGVGNTVTLDSGGNANLADTELDALNAGNGNWADAALIIQRSGTAITSDTFGFNTSGALFTVTGTTSGNLQSGGQTFATYTNINGVLTITLTSSDTTATSALVDDVVQRITYQNNTPAGDATISYALTDGDGGTATTATVTVTTDSIYVTNTTDTASIDIANGVSFSEAVAIAAADATGSQTIVFNGTLAATALTINSLSLNESLTFDMDAASSMSLTSGTITLGAATTQTFTNGTGDTATISSAIGGSGALTKTGAGGLTLSATNSYSGVTSISAGTLTVSNGDAISTNGSVSVSSGATLALSSNETIGNLSGAGSVTLGSNTLTSWITADTTFSGGISGTGGLSVNQSGAATFALTLSGTNTYTGNTTAMNFGSLRLDGDASVSSSSYLRANGNSVITLLSNQTVGSLGSNSATATVNLGSFTLSAGGDNTTTTVAGVVSGTGNLVKQGSGTMTLTATNTYSGTTTVSAGTLAVASDSNLGSNTVTLALGATLDISGATNIDNAIALSGDATVSTSANATLSGVISGAHTLAKSGAAALILSGSNTYAGTTVSAGTLSVASDANLGSGGISLAAGTILQVTGATTVDNSITLTGNATVNNSANATLSGVIGGGFNLAKSGASTLTLSGTNTYNNTTVSAGTLSAASDSNLGSGGVTLAAGTTLAVTGATTIDNAVTLSGAVTVNTSADATLSGNIGGAGSLAKTGANTLTLSGTNSYAGSTNVSAGTLSVAGDGNLGSGTVTLATGSTLAVTGATTIDNAISLAGNATVQTTNAATLSGPISGAGGLIKAGASTLNLSGTDSYTGATSVNAGSLLVNGALSATSATAVASGATLGGSGSISSNITVNSGGTLSPGNSPGTLTVNGNLTMAPGSILAVEINGTAAGTEYDQILVNGSLDVSGAILSATHGYTAGQGDSYTIIVNDAADNITGTFSGLAEGGTTTAGGNSTVLTASYLGDDGNGNDFTLTAPLNAAPVIANLNGDSVSFIEDSDLILLDASNDATVTDDDSVDFDGGNVTVSISSGRVSTEDVLSIRNEGTAGGQIGTSGLNITYGGTLIGTRTADGGTDINDLVITLNSAATPAIIQALVRNLTYTNTNTTSPDTGARTVRITVNDGDGGTSSHADIAVAVVATNDAPTLTATGATPTFTEGGAAVGLFSGTSVSTVESGQLITMLTVTVTNVTEGSDEIMYFDGSDIPLVNGFTGTSLIHSVDISVAVTGSTATLTLVRTGGLSSAQTLVDGMTYANRSTTPTLANRVVTITSVRDDGGTANGGVDTSSPNVSATVTISAVNSAPVVTTSTGVTAFTEGNNVASTPVVIDGDITVSDLDNATLASATASITANFQTAEDVLAFTNDGSTMGNISASYNSSTGVLTLTSTGATATLAEWELALAAVTYTNSSETPSEATREISFTVNDGVETSVVTTKSVSVTAVNNTPIISGTPALSINQGAAYSFTPSVTDADSVVLLFSIANQPAWATFDPITGTLSGTPGNANIGTTAGIVITVSDGTTSTSLPAFILTVLNVNDAPVINSTPVTTATQDVAYSYTLAAADSDMGDVLTLSAATLPSWLSFNPATGVLSGTPTNANVGSHAVTLRATDADGLTVDQSFSITVANVNDAPTISSTAVTTATQDVAYSYTFAAADGDAGDVLTLSAPTLPSWLSFNPATGLLSGTPTNADVGNHAVTLRAIDIDGLFAEQSFSINVTNVNDAPVISGTPLVSVDQDVAYSFTPTASDVDVGDVLTYSITNKPIWAAFDTATGALTGTPTNTDVGTTTGIVITVSDGTLSASLAAFDLTVTNVNEAPVISGTPLVSVDQDVAYSFTPTASDVDVGDVLTYSITNKPTWAAF
ncbi:DUF4347 domain-containing protein, partial [Cellvibrio sp. BR]|uniref:DUF4347 domain-containing protein n=1 Tax=Cellvibrio sp. BR TaxID=1134474 RepID=UPI0012F4F9F5